MEDQSRERSGWETVRRFFEPVPFVRRDLVKLVVYEAIAGGFFILLIFGSQYVVEALEESDMEKMMMWIFIIASGSFFAFLYGSFAKPYVFSMPKSLGQYIDTVYMKKVIYGDSNIYESIGTGRMIAVFEKGQYTWIEFYRNVFGDYVKMLVTIISFFVTLFVRDVYLFRWMMGALVCMGFWFFLFGSYPYFRRKMAKDARTDIVRLKVKWFMSKNEIMQNDQLDNELEKRDNINIDRYRYKRKEKLWQGIAFDGAKFVLTIVYVYVLYSTGIRVSEGSFSYADAVIVIGLGTTFLSHMGSVLRSIRKGVDNWIHIQKMRELVDSLETGIDMTKGSLFEYRKGDVSIEKLKFGYSRDTDNKDDASTVFSNFSLSLPGGTKTALVGPSGSGKSTLVKLIAGYLRPDSGEIIVDGQRLPGGVLTPDPSPKGSGESHLSRRADVTSGHVSLKSYYKHIGYLTQEPSVFDGTVWENLTYAVSSPQPSPSEREDEQLLERGHSAILDAKCEFIYDLPDGLQTEIGERGVRLSGGQRQRLAIAKIFLKNPEIVILDEPTSALDSESEEAVTQAMNRLFEGRTVIIIAHRLQTVKHADRILYLEGGAVVEEGTHKQLMDLGNKYYKMVELQSGF